jgi:hypothetical protein
MENNEKLEDFSWDTWDEPSLGEISQEPKEEPKQKEVLKEEEKVEEEPEEEKDILGEAEDFDKIEFVDEDSQDSSYDENNIIFRLKEEGIFSTLDDEELNENVSNEYLPELIDKEVDARVEETMESFFEELDEDAINFLKFKKNGGSTSQFISMLQSKSEVPSGDIDNESYQEKLVKHGMKLEGYDDEDIEDKIEWLKEGSKLKRHAQKYETKLEKANQIHQQQLLQEQQKQVEAAKRQREELSSNLKNLLEESDTIGQFSFSKRDKKELHSYMTKANVKVGKNSYMTKMQKDLQTAFQDPQKILLIAKLLKNDFDISDVIRNTETKVTRKTKDKIERKSSNIKGSKSSSGRRKKALFEYFDD